MTRRSAAATWWPPAAGLLVLMGLCPMAASLIAVVPRPAPRRRGRRALRLGRRQRHPRPSSRRAWRSDSNVLIVAVSLAVRWIPIAAPEFYHAFPENSKTILDSGISTGRVAGRRPQPAVQPHRPRPGGRRRHLAPWSPGGAIAEQRTGASAAAHSIPAGAGKAGRGATRDGAVIVRMAPTRPARPARCPEQPPRGAQSHPFDHLRLIEAGDAQELHDDPDAATEFERPATSFYHYMADRLRIGCFLRLRHRDPLHHERRQPPHGRRTFFPIMARLWAAHMDLLTDLPTRGDTTVGHDVWCGDNRAHRDARASPSASARVSATGWQPSPTTPAPLRSPAATPPRVIRTPLRPLRVSATARNSASGGTGPSSTSRPMSGMIMSGSGAERWRRPPSH